MPDGSVSVLHRVRTEVDIGRGQLLDQCAEGISLGKSRDLVAKLEVLKNVLNVGGKPVEVRLKVGPELLSAGTGPQVAKGKFRGVVECLSRRLSQGRVLFDHADRIKRRLHLQHGLLTVFQHRIQPAKHNHGKNDVPVLATNVKVAKDIVGDTPNVVGNPI